MPEGDTLYRIANQLRPVLAGQIITAAEAWRPRSGPAIDAPSLVGRRVESVEAVGKHLMIAFDDRRVLHSHLGMTGSWHTYLVGEDWRKPAHRAGIWLATATHVVVNFSPKLLELKSAAELRGDRYLRRLGPDLMLPTVNPADALPRLRRHNAAPIGEAVMNQTLVAGIGNVYKSETLFLTKLDPWRAVASIGDEALLAYLQMTHKLMRRNRGSGWRTTRFAATGPRLWVYGRRGDACLVCGGVIHMRRQGDAARSTYWCPACQPAAGEGERRFEGDETVRRRGPIKGCS
ncbi:MAG: DNA-formamidopyrimidine glycosylase family protein [Planctomycetota bacterium]